MVGQPMQGVAFCDNCWVDPVVPGVHLAACGALGYLLCTVGWSYSCRDSHYDDNHRPDRNHRSDRSCRFGDSRNRGGSHRRACSRPRGSSHPTNCGCQPYTFRGDVASRCPWELAW